MFLALSPICVSLFLSGRAVPVLGISALLWLSAQLGMPQRAGTWAAESFGYPYTSYGGMFSLVAWQLIYVAGVLVGYLMISRPELSDRVRKAAISHLPAFVTLFLLLASLKFYFDLLEIYPERPAPLRDFAEAQSKWIASPLHLISIWVNFMLVVSLLGSRAMATGVVSLASRTFSQLLSSGPLVRLGQNALTVFSAHIVIVYVLGHVFDPTGIPEVVRYPFLLGCTASLLLVPMLSDAALRARMLLRSCLMPG